MLRKSRCLALLVAAAALCVTHESEAANQTIKRPNDHPKYRAELEPHGVLVLWHRSAYQYHGRRTFDDPEAGAGFHVSIELGDPAFVPSINNTVGIHFGVDITSCNRACGSADVQFYYPLAMEWNFFVHEKWSVFAEPGFLVRHYGFYNRGPNIDFYIEGGARYHFNDDIALKMRIGYPFTFTIGPSFFVGD